jgi:hypothetical protein
MKEAPNPKLQAPKKLQAPNINMRTLNWNLNLGASLELGCWCLELFGSVVKKPFNNQSIYGTR